MRSRSRQWMLAALVLAGCEPLTKPPPAGDACHAPPLDQAFDLGSPIAAWNTVRALFDGKSVWVAFTQSYNDDTGASNVMLARIHCDDLSHVTANIINERPAGGPGLAMASDTQHVVVLWSGPPMTQAPMSAHAFELDGTPLDFESTVTVNRGGMALPGALRASTLLPLPGGGFGLAGTVNTNQDNPCPEVFLQRLDDKLRPAGESVDVAANGFGHCTNGRVSLAPSVDGSFYLTWLAQPPTMSGSSLNTLHLAADVFSGAVTPLQQLPSSAGLDVTDLSDATMVAGPGAKLTSTSSAAATVGAWTPQYVVYANKPMGVGDHIFLQDAAQPLGQPRVIPIDVKEGPVERALVASSEHGGVIGWTVAGSDQQHAAMYAARFAYNGQEWNVGDRVQLENDGQAIDRHLQAIVTLSENTFFISWTEGTRGALKLRGSFVSF